MAPSAWQLILVAIIALLLFGGRGKISAIMGDFAKGIKSFRKGLSDEDDDPRDRLQEDKTTVYADKTVHEQDESTKKAGTAD